MDTISSFDELYAWAEINEALDDPIVNQRLNELLFHEVIEMVPESGPILTTNAESWCDETTNNLLIQHMEDFDRHNACQDDTDSWCDETTNNLLIQHMEDFDRHNACQDDTDSWCDETTNNLLIQHMEDFDRQNECHGRQNIDQQGGASNAQAEQPSTSTGGITPHGTLKRPALDTDSINVSPPKRRESSSADNLNKVTTPYSLERTSELVFARNRAHQATYTVRFTSEWQGLSLLSLYVQFEGMFENLLESIRSDRDLNDQDLGRIIINHADLQSSAHFSLRKWSDITAKNILQLFQKLLNSNQSLTLDQSFQIVIGSIRFPRGGSGRRQPFINSGSVPCKRSIVNIGNTDNLCMARALAVCFCKEYQISDEQWRQENISMKRGELLKFVLAEKKCPQSVYINIQKSVYQKDLALKILDRAHLVVHAMRPLSVQDIPAIERALNVRIVVISAEYGNQIIYKGDPDYNRDQPTFFLLHLRESHFCAIVNVAAFYCRIKFCFTCLKGYDHDTQHVCAFSCVTCGSQNCMFGGARECPDCHIICRSHACFVKHKDVPQATALNPNPQSKCSKWYRCPDCHKIMQVKKRTPNQHQCGEWLCPCCKAYNVGTHLCYQRIPNAKKVKMPRFVFFDFETRQDAILECPGGYLPLTTDCSSCQKSNISMCIHRQRCTRCHETSCGKPKHTANFVVSQTVCYLCADIQVLGPESKCPGCGSRCTACDVRDSKTGDFKQPPCPATCGHREVIFEGDNTAHDFGKWLFSHVHKDCVVLSHNGKAFDNYFLLEYLISTGITPKDICFAGSKIMSLIVGKGLNIKLLDSLNFMPMALSGLPKAFGLTELVKGYFPHLFNILPNQHYVGPYPASDDYAPQFMKSEPRQRFLTWHAQKMSDNAIFDFRQEMLKYCRSDVDILRQACLKFRQLVMNVTENDGKGVDPFDYTTIAGVCMGIFKRKFLQERWDVELRDGEVTDSDENVSSPLENVHSALKIGETMKVFVDEQWVPAEDLSLGRKVFVSSNMPQVPANGYTCSDQYSKASITWFLWLSHCHEMETGQSLNIQHALNGGEYQVPNSRYKLDGWEPVTKHCYEFHSCLLHGCKTCYPKRRNTIKLPRTQQTAEELYALREKKKLYLESLGYTYEEMWYCDYVALQNHNTDFKEFVSNCDVQSERLKPRDAFFGGRTNACTLHYQVQPGEKIKYVDFTSLYPFVNKYARYPVGHPEIYTQDFKPLKDYFGIAKLKILPPQNLYHPVLPYRSGGKLKFPLCRTCCEIENMTEKCRHSESERSLMGTWCTPEIMKALEKGYTLITVYEVYHWPQSTQYDRETREGGIFGQYINTFLKLKQEASDWPVWCQSEEDKQRYLHTYSEHEGIQLNPESIQKNPGLRSVAKLALNSFWGKTGECLSKRSHVSFHHDREPDAFYRTLTDTTKEVSNFHILNDKHIYLEWKHKEAFRPEDYKTNVFWACFTTCQARIHLYAVLDMLQEQVLYFDTDSIVYVSRDNLPEPELGDMLGELTNELASPTDYITCFASAGPKNYGYETLEGEKVCKVRGFTLNYLNSQLINFDSVRDLVLGHRGSEDMVVVNPSKIKRDKLKCQLYNVEEKKRYRMVYTKRVILPNLDTLPFGHVDIAL